MSDPEVQTRALLGAPSQQAPEQSGRSTRAYKVAGITLLACVLIVSQAMIAYFLLNQKNEIKTLEDQNNKLDAQLSKGRSVSAPMRLPKPIEMSSMLDEEDASTRAPVKLVTNCQLEAAGLKPLPVPGFHPVCDEQGHYQALQCYMRQCWCVNPGDGQQIPGTLSNGPTSCSTSVVASGLNKVLTMPHADALME